MIKHQNALFSLSKKAACFRVNYSNRPKLLNNITNSRPHSVRRVKSRNCKFIELCKQSRTGQCAQKVTIGHIWWRVIAGKGRFVADPCSKVALLEFE